MLRKYLRPGQTAVDVGAAVGDMTAVMAECVGPAGIVYACEASRLRESTLRKAVSRWPHVTIVMTGVGETTGDMPLYRPASTAASRWHGDHKPPITVPMTTLDALVQRADLVKIDCQGSESHILDGASRLLAQCPTWIVELWPWGLATASRSARTVVDQFRGAGLTPRWNEGDVITDTELMAWEQEDVQEELKFRNIMATRC